MDFSKILENKNLLYGIIGGVVILLVLIIVISVVAVNAGGGGSNKENVVGQETLENDVDLLTTESIGKALEIQALLAKQGIIVKRVAEGSKSKLVLEKKKCSTLSKKCTITDRDQAIITIVQSGLVDQNVGLEIFDKGDFTSTKEDKRIRLARAMNGELARLIKQIKPIQNATVFISIPDNSSYFGEEKPKTATVQLVMPAGKDYEKLDQFKVKAITNLLMGSISDLKAENIAITDTNGNVYHSIMDAEDEMLQKLEENDKYMQQKISKQLDRLVGPGNYVATVSTFLRQAPVERFSIEYDPNKKASVSEQSFREGLGDQSKDQSQGISAVSTYLPNGLQQNMGSDSSQNRNYSRQATETQYGVTKVQTNEYIKPGVIEDVSIAVTIDKNNMPNITTRELKDLIARAASPRVTAANVSIAYTNGVDATLTPERQQNLPKPDKSGNPWWLAVLISVIGIIIVFNAISSKVRKAKAESEEELAVLRQRTMEQEKQLSDITSRANQLTQRQSELAQDLLNQQGRVAIPQFDENLLLSSLDNLSKELDEDNADRLKSWIEDSSYKEKQ